METRRDIRTGGLGASHGAFTQSTHTRHSHGILETLTQKAWKNGKAGHGKRSRTGGMESRRDIRTGGLGEERDNVVDQCREESHRALTRDTHTRNSHGTLGTLI
jgi:hypothetical protein